MTHDYCQSKARVTKSDFSGELGKRTFREKAKWFGDRISFFNYNSVLEERERERKK